MKDHIIVYVNDDCMRNLLLSDRMLGVQDTFSKICKR